jgi:hypothetical protein
VRHQGILVRRSDNRELLGLGVESEPCPTRALDTRAGRVQLLLQLIDRPEIALDGLLERSYSFTPRQLAIDIIRKRNTPADHP